MPAASASRAIAAGVHLSGRNGWRSSLTAITSPIVRRLRNGMVSVLAIPNTGTGVPGDLLDFDAAA